MQCCEFKMVVTYMRLRVSEARLGRHYHRLELADVLMERGLSTIECLPEIDALVSELRARPRSAV